MHFLLGWSLQLLPQVKSKVLLSFFPNDSLLSLFKFVRLVLTTKKYTGRVTREHETRKVDESAARTIGSLTTQSPISLEVI